MLFTCATAASVILCVRIALQTGARVTVPHSVVPHAVVRCVQEAAQESGGDISRALEEADVVLLLVRHVGV